MENSPIKISVVVPIYNVEEYLEECLRSVVNQTLKEIEVICIDDGSPDNSIAIMNRFAEDDDRVRIISQENKGLSISRNIGLNLSKGEYVYFLDSDDYLADVRALETMYEAANKDLLDILSFNYRTIGMEEREYRASLPRDEILNGREYLQEEGATSGMAWLRLFRKEYLTEIDFIFTPDITSEDDESFPRLYIDAKKVGHIDDILLVYRRRENSITTSVNVQRRIGGLIAIINTYFELSTRTTDTVLNRFLYKRALEYLFLLYYDILLVDNKDEALSRYKSFFSKCGFSWLETLLIKNEEKYIEYYSVNKKSKTYNPLVYYIRKFRRYYFNKIRSY